MATLDDFFDRFMFTPTFAHKVRTKTIVRQSPCAEEEDGSPSPDVPKGTIGTIEAVDDDDEDDVRVWVNFDEPYETVLCDPDEIELV